MNKLTIRILTLLCAVLMLIGTLGLVACVTPNGNDTDTTTTGGNGGTETPDTPEVAEWLVADLDEKLAALNNHYGRAMSIAWGGDVKNFAPGSLKAIEAAIALGADAVGIYVKKTEDNVLIALPSVDLFDSTNYSEMKGKDGLPSQTVPKVWTYEEIQKLVLKNYDGTNSEEKVAKLEDVLKLCAGKCLVYIEDTEKTFEEMGEDIYNAAKAANAYTSFLITPARIAAWAEAHNDDAALTEAMKTVSKFYYQMDYFSVRTPVDPTKSDKDSGWERVKDDAEGWAKAYKAEKSLLITNDIEGYSEWVSKTFKSAKEYTPDQFDHVEYSLKREDLSARYMFISDIHYAPIEYSGYINRDTYRGYSNKERMEKLCRDIENEYNERGLDAIFILGDLTTDDPPHRPDSFLKELYDKYLTPLKNKLNIPILATGGNHDGYANTAWKLITGNDRQCVWENKDTGDVVLIVDTYNPATTKTNKPGSGVDWSGNDEVWIEQQLEKYKDRENVFICSHYFGRDQKLYKLAGVVKKYPNVTALFDAHSHSYTEDCVQLKGNIGAMVNETDKMIINTGSYSYGDTAYVYVNGTKYYDFNYHDAVDVWGFQIVETSGDKAITYRIDVEAFYCAENYTTPDKDGGEFITIRDYRPYKKYEEIILK